MSDDEEESTPNLTAKVLFRSETLIGRDNLPFQTIELMQKGTKLVCLQESEKKTFPPVSVKLEAGEYTGISPDKTTIIAETDGYPLIASKTNKGCETITVSMLPLVSLADDKMEATINFYPPGSDFPKLSAVTLSEMLIAEQVVFGHSHKQLESLLKSCLEESIYPVSKTVARGLMPLNGRDSFLRFAFDTGPLPGKLMKNGKIDFRERKMFMGIDKGKDIATLVPPTSGTPGITVTGDKIPQIPGKKISLSSSDGVTLDEKSGLICASYEGTLSSVTDTSIKVCDKQSISGDIDYNTGNIESHGALEISGSVLPGFKVTCRGDLLIHGNINNAAIECGGNLIVKGGITGRKCSVNVKGDADFKFMEYGRLRATGKVIIRKQAYYSKIMADGEIHAHESSQIMAGVLMGAESISVGNAGSPHSSNTLIAAGVAPGRYLRHLKMLSKLRELEQKRLSFFQRYGENRKRKKQKSLEEKILTLYQSMESLNLIPGTSPGTLDDIICKHYISRISITFLGTIFQGTELQIGNTTINLKKNHRSICFSLNKDNILINKNL